MKDFIDKAQGAVGKPSEKSKPTRPDGSRAKDVRQKKGSSLGSLKGSVRGSKPMVEYSDASTGRSAPPKGPKGSSAGLKNQTSAVLQMPGGGYENNSTRNNSKISLPQKSPSNPIGKTNGGRHPVVTDYTRKGRSAKHNSIGSLDRRMKLDKKIR